MCVRVEERVQNELQEEDVLLNITTMADNHANQKEVEKASEKERSVCYALSQTGTRAYSGRGRKSCG